MKVFYIFIIVCLVIASIIQTINKKYKDAIVYIIIALIDIYLLVYHPEWALWPFYK